MSDEQRREAGCRCGRRPSYSRDGALLAGVIWRRQIRDAGKEFGGHTRAAWVAGRIFELGERALRAGRASSSSDEAEIARRMRGAIVGDAHTRIEQLLAAAGLSYAQRLLTVSFERRRRMLSKAAGRARDELLAAAPAP